MGNFHITLYDNLYDNKTNKGFDLRNWNRFKKLFLSFYDIEMTKKHSSTPLISPAVFEKNTTTRSNSNVIAWGGWCAFDVDTHSFKCKNEIKEYFLSQYPDTTFILYSTPSSTIKKPKFRIVFPLKRWITDNKEIRSFWYCMNKKMVGLVDKQTKDVSRMFYPPGNWKESNNKFIYIIENDNTEPLDHLEIIDEIGFTAEILLEDSRNRIIDKIPEKMKLAVEQHHRRQLLEEKERNCLYSWTSFRDCPFVDRQAVSEYNSIVRSNIEGRYRGLYVLMVSIAGRAIQKKYPITEMEVEQLIREIDTSIDGFYKNRKIAPEVRNAISYAYRNIT